MSASSPGSPGSVRAGESDTSAGRGHDRPRRLSTETKASFKTTELIAYLATLAAILIAGLVITGGDDDEFRADRVWLYATILTSAYMLARGLAKSGSREPYDDDR